MYNPREPEFENADGLVLYNMHTGEPILVTPEEYAARVDTYWEVQRLQSRKNRAKSTWFMRLALAVLGYRLFLFADRAAHKSRFFKFLRLMPESRV